MLFSSSVALALVPFVFAAVLDVQVGSATGDLAFTPEAISAQPGDQVVFHFYPKNHTVTQSSFADPCGPKPGGVDSGFMPVAANASSFPTFTVPINDTTPFWVYCKQGANTPASHCGKGMVFAVNCGADGAPNSFTNFKNAALAVGASLSASASATGAPTASAPPSGVTIPPAPDGSTVTATISVSTSSWTTTYSSYPGSPDATPASLTGNVINVVVGGPGVLAFNPPFVSAKPRDTIIFEFHQKNHTVTQSSFANPCVQLNANSVPGFDSGFMPVASDASSFPTWSLTVNDSNPIWAYCRQAGHCGSGMVFAVNPVQDSARNFSAFQGLAMSMNGTGSGSSSGSPSSSASPKPTSGASALSITGSGITIALGALLASLL
jgi:plastocyanin